MRLLRLLCVLLLASVPASARLSGVASSPASILSITANPPTGTITAIGATETFTFCLSSAITVTGVPTLPLNTSTVASSATYASGSGTKCLVFNYTTVTNGAANPVATTISGIVVGGATLTDANGFTPNLSGAKNIPFPGLVFAPGGGSGPVVNSVACSPATGLLTSTSGTNTATCTAVFSSGSMAVSGTPTLTLANQGTPTVCPFSAVSGANVSFACTFGAGSSTPISGKNTYLTTANSGAIGLPGGATISSGGNNAVLSAASGITFTGLSVNTSAAYFISTTGTDTGSGTGACSKASPCATLNFVRGLIEANSTKQVYVRGGNYTPAQTCSWVSDQGSHPTVSTVLCLTSADTNTAWLGYPGETPAFNGGATNSGNGVNDFVYLSGGIRGAIFNGLRANNFTFGDIEGNNAGYTITNNVFDGLFQPSGSTDSYGCVGMFEQIANPDIEYNLCMNTQGSGIVVISDSSGSIGVSGTVTVAHNIILNTCLSLVDCGALYAYDQSHTMANCSWSDNIIGNFGASSALASAIYFDDYMSNCAVHQNQLYADGNGTSGQPSWMIHWHGGNLLKVNSNLLVMDGIFSSVSSHNPDVHYYQSANSGAGGGYNGDMDGNQFETNIVYSTVAPFTSSCVGSSTLNCGYLWIWEFDGGTTIDNPTVSGNAYRTTTGSFTNLGSNPSQSSGTFGPITELGAFAGNPGVSFSTSASACGFGPAVPSGTRCYTATNPPGLALLTGQGPH